MRTTGTVTGTVRARCTRLNTVRVFKGDTRTATAARTSVEQAPDGDLAPAFVSRPSPRGRTSMPERLPIADPRDRGLRPPELAEAPRSPVHVFLQCLLIVVGVALALWALYQLAAVVFVLILAALFAYVVEPLVHLAEFETRIADRPRRLSRGAAVAVVCVLLAGG